MQKSKEEKLKPFKKSLNGNDSKNKDRRKRRVKNKLNLFAKTIKDIKAGVYITDLENNTMFANGSLADMFGYANNRELLDRPLPLMNPPNISLKRLKHAPGINRKIRWEGNLVSKKKDGKYFNLFLSTSVIRNEKGLPGAIVGICLEYTDLKEPQKFIQKKYSLQKMLNDITVVTNKTFNKATIDSVNKIAKSNGSNGEQSYIVENDKLISSLVWDKNIDNRNLPFKILSDTEIFRIGDGLGVKAFDNARSSWLKIFDLNDHGLLKGSETNINSARGSSIWVPVIKEEDAAAIGEFLKNNETQLTKRTVKKIEDIRVLIGKVYEMDRDFTQKNFEMEFKPDEAGTVIKEARINKKFTQEDLALKSGTTKFYISRVENNATDMRLSTLMKIIGKGLDGKLKFSSN